MKTTALDSRENMTPKGGYSTMRRLMPIFLILICLTGCSAKDWRTASREPAGLAPDPAVKREAVLQVYGASAWGWRGWFAIHTWIAAKQTNEASYTVYEVIGWRQRRGLPVVRIEKDLPDRYWLGGGQADHSSRPGCEELPMARYLHGLPGAEQQHLHRLDIAAGPRAGPGTPLFSHRKRICRFSISITYCLT
jgi:hypothetical protein